MLSHGPKHFRGNALDRPGVRPQLVPIATFVRRNGLEVAAALCDHARSPTGPESLPNLFAALKHVGRHGIGMLALYEAERLFRKLSYERRDQMLLALEPYHSVIFDVRRNRLLSDLRHEQWLDVASASKMSVAPGRGQPLGAEDARLQTFRARLVSKRVRANMADEAARQIVELREELARARGIPSNRALAREANARGLKTTRGNDWSDVAIARALKRIGEDHGG